MKLKKFKSGQMHLSFGMIFSIILIIAFIAFAFYGIRFFLRLQDTTKIGTFRENFQKDVDAMWKGSQGRQEVKYDLPNKIEQVCLKNWQYENLAFIPEDSVKLDPVNISHLDIPKDICFDNINGKISMILKKDYGENSVSVLRS
jgi:hypothetical protein